MSPSKSRAVFTATGNQGKMGLSLVVLPSPLTSYEFDWVMPGDSKMALRKSPALCLLVKWNATLDPPEDSPKIVTRVGSPPKAAMLRCTH